MERDPSQPVSTRITRRRFFFFGAAAGISLVAAPVLKLLPPVAEAVDWGYDPAFHVVHIPNRHIYARIRISREAIEDSRFREGAFRRFVAEEYRQMMAMIQAEQERADGCKFFS